jgi:hypothetical protein
MLLYFLPVCLISGIDLRYLWMTFGFEKSWETINVIIGLGT